MRTRRFPASGSPCARAFGAITRRWFWQQMTTRDGAERRRAAADYVSAHGVSSAIIILAIHASKTNHRPPPYRSGGTAFLEHGGITCALLDISPPVRSRPRTVFAILSC